MISKIRIFLLGMREFRSMVTTSFDPPEINSYDWGREWAHRLTLRCFEPERIGGIVDLRD